MKAAKTVLALGLVSLAGALAYRSCDTDVVPTPAQWAPTEGAAPPASPECMPRSRTSTRNSAWSSPRSDVVIHIAS